MAHFELPVDYTKIEHEADRKILKEVASCRATARKLMSEERHMDALERSVEALRTMREFSDFEKTEFRVMLVSVLFDLAEIHYQLKDYKQSEKEVELLFKLLDRMVKEDAERFGHVHFLAMELSTRILRSRKKAMDMLVKQQIAASALYDKVNSGVVAATDKLVEALRKVGRIQASAGQYKAALKFYSEAIKFAKKRAGRVTRQVVKMTIEMAEIMMRIRSMRPRAQRLLQAVLPHAVELGTIELEEDILALLEIINQDIEKEPKWKAFLHKLNVVAKKN